MSPCPNPHVVQHNGEIIILCCHTHANRFVEDFKRETKKKMEEEYKILILQEEDEITTLGLRVYKEGYLSITQFREGSPDSVVALTKDEMEKVVQFWKRNHN